MCFGVNFSFEGWKKRINDVAGFNLKINGIRKNMAYKLTGSRVRTL